MDANSWFPCSAIQTTFARRANQPVRHFGMRFDGGDVAPCLLDGLLRNANALRNTQIAGWIDRPSHRLLPGLREEVGPRRHLGDIRQLGHRFGSLVSGEVLASDVLVEFDLASLLVGQVARRHPVCANDGRSVARRLWRRLVALDNPARPVISVGGLDRVTDGGRRGRVEGDAIDRAAPKLGSVSDHARSWSGVDHSRAPPGCFSIRVISSELKPKSCPSFRSVRTCGMRRPLSHK